MNHLVAILFITLLSISGQIAKADKAALTAQIGAGFAGATPSAQHAAVETRDPRTNLPSPSEVIADRTSSGIIAQLTPDGRARGRLDGAESAWTYHTYFVDVHARTTLLTVKLDADIDLDLAIKYGSEIEHLGDKEQGGDWDYRDMRTANPTMVVINEPQPGRWYIDVFNALGANHSGNYRLTLAAQQVAYEEAPSTVFQPLSDEPRMPAPQEEPVFVGTWSVEARSRPAHPYGSPTSVTSTWVISLDDGQVLVDGLSDGTKITSIEYTQNALLFSLETLHLDGMTTIYAIFIDHNRAVGEYYAEHIFAGNKIAQSGTINMVRIHAEQFGAPGLPGLTPYAPPDAPERQSPGLFGPGLGLPPGELESPWHSPRTSQRSRADCLAQCQRDWYYGCRPTCILLRGAERRACSDDCLARRTSCERMC